MTIHYENYRRFSKGQGFAGVLCRGLGAQVSSERWMAATCTPCRERIVEREVISRDGTCGVIVTFDSLRVTIGTGRSELRITWDAFDQDWAPIELLGQAFDA